MSYQLKLNNKKLEDVIKNNSLIKNKSYINNKWIGNGASLVVNNPSNGDGLLNLRMVSEEDVDNAINAAHSALPVWSNIIPKERCQLMKEWYKLIIENEDDLAKIMVLEQGKIYNEALVEIRYGASFIEWFAEQAKRIKGEILSPHMADKRLLTYRQPVGVVGAITPWNFPSAMIARKVAPALAAGCTIIVKPASETPLSALALAELAHAAGFPMGVINVIIGNGKMIGQKFTSSDVVRKISFTGSTEVGKILMRDGAHKVKKISMELGGNAPFIIFDDANLDEAVDGVISSKFRNSGQTCICANRIFVQENILAEFKEKFIAKLQNFQLGSGLEQNVVQGPLINEEAVNKINDLINDAKKYGAIVDFGGQAVGKTQFFEPTVISNLNNEMAIYREEIFGPVAAIWSFKDEKEAIKLANDSNYGLAAYFYSQDYKRIWRVSERLEYGMIGVNEGIISTEIAPFGGVKESGIGREGATQGIDEYLETKYVCLGGIK